MSLGKTYCDRDGCTESIENPQESAFRVKTPADLSSLSASEYCSSRCAKIAMKRYDETTP